MSELLEDYGFWAGMVKSKRREIERLEEKKLSITMTNDGLPKGSSRYTMEDYIADKEQLTEDLQELQAKKWEAYDRIFGVLVKMKHSKQIDVLYRRYIYLDSWKKICADMGYSKSYVMSLHDRAKENFEAAMYKT